MVAGSGLVPDECAMGDIQGLLVALCALLFGQSSCSEPPTEEGLGQGGGRPDASTTDSQSPPSRCGFEQSRREKRSLRTAFPVPPFVGSDPWGAAPPLEVSQEQ